MSTAFNGQSNTRERTQLFANVDQYNPSHLMRPETPRFKSQSPSYSDSVLQQVESQNDEQIDLLTSKLRILKNISSKIGDEVKDGTGLLHAMEEGFDSARVKVKSTMRRMISTSRDHGIGWREWIGFFGLVWVVFFLVWLL